MENASKALIMAGGILIALMTIGALVFMFNSISEVEKQKNQNAEIDAVLEFNRQFEAFDMVGLRGSDLLTVINKMSDYNERSNDVLIEGYEEMEMSVQFKSIFTSPTGQINEDDTVEWGELEGWIDVWFGENAENLSTKEEKEQLTEFKRKYFKCTNLEYDNDTGRVISMEFEEIKVQ